MENPNISIENQDLIKIFTELRSCDACGRREVDLYEN